MDSFGRKIVFYYLFVPLLLVFGLIAACSNSVDSYWKEELPCGTSSQGSFTSNEDGSWSEWAECKGY